MDTPTFEITPELIVGNLKYMSSRLLEEGHTVDSAVDFFLASDYRAIHLAYAPFAADITDEFIYQIIDTPNEPPEEWRHRQYAVIRRVLNIIAKANE